jgi:hypothetical protein
VYEGLLTHPSSRTPGGGEEEDVQAGEDDEALRSSITTLADSAHDGNDEFANKHANSTADQNHAATKFLNGPERTDVEPTLTAVVIIAMTKAFLIPTVLKKVVP